MGRGKNSTWSPAHAASGPDASGQINPLPIALAPMAAGSAPGTCADGAVEREFADRRIAADRVRRDRVHRRHQAERDRQVEVAALLRQIGGREIDGDVLVGKAETDGVQRGAHPLAAFGDGLVRQTDDGEAGSAGRDADLDLDGSRFNADERQRGNLPVHWPPHEAPTLERRRNRGYCLSVKFANS